MSEPKTSGEAIEKTRDWLDKRFENLPFSASLMAQMPEVKAFMDEIDAACIGGDTEKVIETCRQLMAWVQGRTEKK